ncbi:MAG: hypothetical protein ACW98F_12925, partial [Candidatus Hodarchaeales archaeon]
MQKKVKNLGYMTLSITILVFTIFLTIGAIPRDIHIIEEEVPVSAHLWSSDGTKLAYIKSSYRHNGELWVAEFRTQPGASPYSARSAMASNIRNHQLIYTGVMAGGLLDWQDDWILFVLGNETLPPSAYHGISELWKIRDDGSDLTQVTFTYTNGIKYTNNPAYTNRGSTGWGKFIPNSDPQLVYFSAHNGNGWYRPIVCNADGTDGWYYVSSSPYLYSFTVGMSPTGNKLLWGDATYWDNPTRALMASNVDGSGKVLTGGWSYRTTPLVLVDGNTIVYQHVRTRYIGTPPLAGNIYAMNIDGT